VTKVMKRETLPTGEIVVYRHSVGWVIAGFPSDGNILHFVPKKPKRTRRKRAAAEPARRRRQA
jgi:hypothetical protein